MRASSAPYRRPSGATRCCEDFSGSSGAARLTRSSTSRRTGAPSPTGSAARRLTLTDVRPLGRGRVIGCWESDGVLIDPGPTNSMETLIEALGGEQPRAVLLTHIHLAHAGASGSMVRRWPDLPVYVHE